MVLLSGHLEGSKLVADGLTKPLQGQSFQRFVEKLNMCDLSKLQEDTAGMKKVSFEEVSDSTWEDEKLTKLKLLGSLLLHIGKKIYMTIGAILIVIAKLWQASKKKARQGEVEMPSIRALRGGDQWPMRPSAPPGLSQAQERGRAVYGESRPVRDERLNSERPWWFHEELGQIPRGSDRWFTHLPNLVVRVHGKSRRRCFHPLHRSCPVDLATMTGRRHTIIYVAETHQRDDVEDDWSQSQTWTKDFRWLGMTIFEKHREGDLLPERDAPTTYESGVDGTTPMASQHGPVGGGYQETRTSSRTNAGKREEEVDERMSRKTTARKSGRMVQHININVNVQGGAGQQASHPASSSTHRSVGVQETSDSEFEIVSQGSEDDHGGGNLES